MSEFKSGKASKQGVDVFTNVRKLYLFKINNSKFSTQKKTSEILNFQNSSLAFDHQVDILVPFQNFSFFSVESQMIMHPIQVVLLSSWLAPMVAQIFFVVKAHLNFRNFRLPEIEYHDCHFPPLSYFTEGSDLELKTAKNRSKSS